MMAMEQIQWPLAVLSRAIHYKNLTSASQHVGLSQPQLSRIIAKLEEELQLVLLDRTSKRQSVWTKSAFELARVYEQSSRKLQHAISELQFNSQPTHIHIGTLEGLLPLATQFAHEVFSHTTTRLIEVDMFDQNEIEAQFTSNKVDLIFTSRIPGKIKPKFILELGHQDFENYTSPSPYDVFSPYEFNREKSKSSKDRKVFISNSLTARRLWIESYGGLGKLPGKVKASSKKTDHAVLVIGSELLNPQIWEQTQKLKKLI